MGKNHHVMDLVPNFQPY